MVIIKMSEKTVQCCIAAQELREMGLTPEAVMREDEKCATFMAQINKEVGEQLGYDPENEVMMLSKNVLTDGSVRIFAVKMNNDDIQKSADKVRSMAQTVLDYLSQDKIDEVKNEKGEAKGAALSELINEMNRMVSQIYVEGSDKSESQPYGIGVSGDGNLSDEQKPLQISSKPAMEYQRYMGVFKDLDSCIRFSHIALSMPIVDSALFKQKDVYYLILGVKTVNDATVFELRKAGLEYAENFIINSPGELHLVENGDCIISKDAVMHLGEMEVGK
ncbi:adaptor protein MecA [Butyrivibrio sp. NC3005]|uniref:adaptor protein MecA n=1 Tax=Butyrivibrio sp. NC3005 TaxID=1280685 RepID=UPI000407992A|nr:adaptor protein MecA [Butyrivibrio sp. NC3005]